MIDYDYGYNAHIEISALKYATQAIKDRTERNKDIYNG